MLTTRQLSTVQGGPCEPRRDRKTGTEWNGSPYPTRVPRGTVALERDEVWETRGSLGTNRVEIPVGVDGPPSVYRSSTPLRG